MHLQTGERQLRGADSSPRWDEGRRSVEDQSDVPIEGALQYFRTVTFSSAFARSNEGKRFCFQRVHVTAKCDGMRKRPQQVSCSAGVGGCPPEAREEQTHQQQRSHLRHSGCHRSSKKHYHVMFSFVQRHRLVSWPDLPPMYPAAIIKARILLVNTLYTKYTFICKLTLT